MGVAQVKDRWNEYADRAWKPCFNATTIHGILNIYRSWYQQGLSDKQISEKIRACQRQGRWSEQ